MDKISETDKFIQFYDDTNSLPERNSLLLEIEQLKESLLVVEEPVTQEEPVIQEEPKTLTDATTPESKSESLEPNPALNLVIVPILIQRILSVTTPLMYRGVSVIKELISEVKAKITGFSLKRKIVGTTCNPKEKLTIKRSLQPSFKTKTLVIALIALTLTFQSDFVNLVKSNPIKSAEKQFLSSSDPVTVLTQELDSALAYALNHNNTFYGYQINNPVIGVVGGSELILTFLTDGRCWSTGITQGYPAKEIRYDPTGVRCDKVNLDAIAQIIK